MPAAPRFAYYDRLTSAQKATYRRSDALTVTLPDPYALRPLVVALEAALDAGKQGRVGAAVRAFSAAFLAQLGAPALKIHVRAVRPQIEDGELHGLYTYATETEGPTLEVWMRTSAHERTVKFRTFFRTLVHELLHHLDVTVFELDESFHTAGFFRRESSLVRQLAGTREPPAPREPAPPRQGSLF